MRVLVLGSLGPNQDRIRALASRVDSVVYAYSEFHPNILRLEGAVTCVPLARLNLAPQLRYLLAFHGITVVYSLLNAWDGSTEVTQELLDDHPKVPVVRHYKEHPCVPTHEERRLLLETDAQIYINDASYDYFRSVYPVSDSSAHVMDADMIAEAYMTDDLRPKKRLADGEPHLLVAGGMSVADDRLDVRQLCTEMSRRRVHVHLYGYMIGSDNAGRQVHGDSRTRGVYKDMAATLPYVHLHEYISPDRFCSEWSVYDAGFMHPRVPATCGQAAFEEMNLPHRYSAYLAAALPLAVCGEGQHAMRALVERSGIGFPYATYDELADVLRDDRTMEALTAVVRRVRRRFSFDNSANTLVEILGRYAS